MAHKGPRSSDQRGRTAWGIGLACLLLAGLAGAAEVHTFGNGITATIHSVDELAAAAQTRPDGDLELETSVGAVTLVPAQKSWVPFPEAAVLGALESMRDLQTRVDVHIYILPSVPAAAGGSFARRDAIFLAPGTGAIDATTAAYITTHEMGHVLTWAFLDPSAARWAAYLDLRGLDLQSNGPAASHADRAREILAEDIRYLFGGPEATVSRSIENHDLVLPHRVAGLQDLLAGYFQDRNFGPVAVRASAFPNPCNPMTTISMAIPGGLLADGSGAVLQVFDIRGALVKTVRGADLANDRLAVRWNGTDNAGSLVASGRYLYLMEAAGLTARGAVTLVR